MPYFILKINFFKKLKLLNFKACFSIEAHNDSKSSAVIFCLKIDE